MLKRRKQFGAGRGKCFFAKERARRAVAIGVRCMGRSSNIWSVAIVNGWCGANAFDGARMRWIAPRVICALVRFVLPNRPADNAALVCFVLSNRPADVTALVCFV